MLSTERRKLAYVTDAKVLDLLRTKLDMSGSFAVSPKNSSHRPERKFFLSNVRRDRPESGESSDDQVNGRLVLNSKNLSETTLVDVAVASKLIVSLLCALQEMKLFPDAYWLTDNTIKTLKTQE